MTFSIDHIALESPVILAPMSGVSDMPFRRLVKRMGAGLVISEMIASQAMIRQTRQTMKMIEKSADELPMAVQLAGCEPHVMAEAAKLNVDMGAQIIDINMGCPVKKIVNGHAGSALMRDEDLASRILEATVKAVNVPVTLKMRTGWDDNSRNAPKLAKIAESHGIKMITVHGRTRCQLYNGKSDWDFIRRVKESVSIPVVGNGDVVALDDAKTLLEKSGADGVMVGRGSYGRPWFLNQIDHFLKTGERLDNPSPREVHAIVREHADMIFTHYGMQTGVKMARKHMAWYSKGFHGSADFRVRVNQMETPADMLSTIDDFFTPFYS